MIFNSYVYLLLFLPISLLGYFLLKRVPLRVAFAWLVLVSLVFYGWWNPDETGQAKWTPFYVLLILGSCLGNYFFGWFIASHKQTGLGKGVLTVGVVANLLLLGYYKYAGFLVGVYQEFTGAPHQIPHIVLPLAISFFTFLQIAYLVDAYRGETKEVNFTDYLLFVTFFPHLIAGPLVHHKEMLPQFTKGTCRHRLWASLSVGLTYLILGLFKKVVIADNAALVANAIFGLAASESRQLTFLEGWAGALTYAIRLYFDFSGYSDMAIGSARLFGIRFPLNFHSPYKAVSIIDFWRRWHMTLSRFLRDYLYFPLGGNRKGKTRRYVNLLLTMVLGGIWHGAGFAFLLWGFLHGAFLCINHGWIAFRKKHNIKPIAKPLAIGITFLLVVIAWVPFYAGSFEHGPNGSTQKAITVTKNMYAAMFGLNGFEAWPDRSAYVAKASHAGRAVLWLAVCWLLPNTQLFLRRYSPALDVATYDEDPLGKQKRSWMLATPLRRACLLIFLVLYFLPVVLWRFRELRREGMFSEQWWERPEPWLRKMGLNPRRWWQWRPTTPWFVFTFLLLIVILTQFDKVSEFIYFQF